MSRLARKSYKGEKLFHVMVQGINILYVLLLLPLGAYCCSRALGAQEFWLKYIFPVACGLFEMCYMNVLNGEPIELDIILSSNP